MALADSSADGLTWLLSGSVFDGDVSSLIRPGSLLVASGLEDTLVGEDQMFTVLEDLLDLLLKLDGPLGVLIEERLLHLWCRHGLDGLVGDTR